MGNILRLATDGQRPILGGYDFFWRTILDKTSAEQPCFTFRDIDGACSPGFEDLLTKFMRFLLINGYVEIAKQPDLIGRARVYRVLKRQRDTPKFSRDGHPGKKGAAQQQLWNVIRRKLQGFTVADLAIEAATADVPVAFQTAKDYCRVLAEAGILREIAANHGKRSGKSYVLLGKANTGPKAPVRYLVKLIFDPNTGLVAGDATGAEVTA